MKNKSKKLSLSIYSALICTIENLWVDIKSFKHAGYVLFQQRILNKYFNEIVITVNIVHVNTRFSAFS